MGYVRSWKRTEEADGMRSEVVMSTPSARAAVCSYADQLPHKHRCRALQGHDQHAPVTRMFSACARTVSRCSQVAPSQSLSKPDHEAVASALPSGEKAHAAMGRPSPNTLHWLPSCSAAVRV